VRYRDCCCALCTKGQFFSSSLFAIQAGECSSESIAENGRAGVIKSNGQRQVVGVIDDEPGVLTGLRRILNASGLGAEVFLSAEDLLARGSLSGLTCLVIDINLGGMSGIELRRRLAAAGSAIPVIFITARDDEATRREAMNVGCAAYLGKPFPGRALIDAITDAVGKG
jgi:FixJ family two-component response regulator